MQTVMASTAPRRLAISLLFIALFGCGSGGSDSSSTDDQSSAPPGGETPPSGNTAPYSGSLFFRTSVNGTEAYSRYTFSDQSVSSIIPNRGRFSSISNDGNHILNVEPSGNELFGYDANAKPLFQHDLEQFEIKSIPRYSHDNRFIAAIVSNVYANLAIFTPDGQLLNGVDERSIGNEPGDLLSAADWTPGGQLIFAYGDNIYRLHDIYNDSFELIAADVAQSDTDALMNLIVSPSGQQVAYVSGSYYSQSGNTFVLDLDTKIRTQLTTGPGQVTQIAWSPDGKHIAMAFGSEAGTDQCGALWIVPSNSETPVEIEYGSENGEVGAYRVKSISNGNAKDICTTDGLDWR